MNVEPIAKVGKTGLDIASPFGKINLYITIFFLIVIVIFSVTQALKQDSIFPIVDGVFLRFFASDVKISQEVDKVMSEDVPHFEGFKPFTKNFWQYLWHRTLFWFDMIVNIYFLFIVIYLLYQIFNWINTTNPAINFWCAILLVMFLNMIIGMALFSTNFAGKCVIDDREAIMKESFNYSIPFKGIYKLVKYIWTGDLFSKAYDFSQTGIGKIISGVPEPYNATNST